jgi:methionyl-tRNA synthetase
MKKYPQFIEVDMRQDVVEKETETLCSNCGYKMGTGNDCLACQTYNREKECSR